MNLLVTICVNVFYVPCEKEQHATNNSIFWETIHLNGPYIITLIYI